MLVFKFAIIFLLFAVIVYVNVELKIQLKDLEKEIYEFIDKEFPSFQKTKILVGEVSTIRGLNCVTSEYMEFSNTDFKTYVYFNGISIIFTGMYPERKKIFHELTKLITTDKALLLGDSFGDESSVGFLTGQETIQFPDRGNRKCLIVETGKKDKIVIEVNFPKEKEITQNLIKNYIEVVRKLNNATKRKIRVPEAKQVET